MSYRCEKIVVSGGEYKWTVVEEGSRRACVAAWLRERRSGTPAARVREMMTLGRGKYAGGGLVKHFDRRVRPETLRHPRSRARGGA